MGLSVSLFLIAAGAILAFAVDATVQGIDLVTVGWILMAVGVLGTILSLAAWQTWGGFNRGTAVSRRSTVVEREDFP